MALNLTPQEKAYLASIKDHEDLSSISYILQSIIQDMDLPLRDFEVIDDKCADICSECEDTGLAVPKFIGFLRNLYDRAVSGGASTPQTDMVLTPFNGPQPFQNAFGMQPQQPQKVKKPKAPKPQNLEPKVVKPKVDPLVQYLNTDIDGDNIPEYLVTINDIINKIVAAKNEELIRENIQLKEKISMIQSLFGGLNGKT